MPEPTAQPQPTDRKPDAILFPRGWPCPTAGASRLDALLNHFEPILGVGRGQGQVQDVAGGDPPRQLVTRRPHDTLNFPEGHAKAKFPRFDWYPQPDGLEFGYYKAGASPQEMGL